MTGVNAGNAVIIYSLGSGCTAMGTVTVYAAPSVITGTASICPGNTTALSSATAGGTWSSVSGIVNVGSASGIVTGITDGTATITYTSTSTGCATTKTITINPLPLAITGSMNICVGQSTALTDASTTGGTWKSPDPKAVGVCHSNRSGLRVVGRYGEYYLYTWYGLHDYHHGNSKPCSGCNNRHCGGMRRRCLELIFA